MSPSNLPRTSIPVALLLCGLNWLIPGAGYIACRDYARGISLLVLINLCFAIGLWMGGYLLPPDSWVPFTPGFNLVAMLTYLSQTFHGGGWLVLSYLQDASDVNPQSPWNPISLAIRNYSDLGVFHFIAAGSLNYFATVRLYDLLAGNPELTDGSAEAPVQPETPASMTPETKTEGTT